jgi:hypothetical protein
VLGCRGAVHTDLEAAEQLDVDAGGTAFGALGAADLPVLVTMHLR